MTSSTAAPDLLPVLAAARVSPDVKRLLQDYPSVAAWYRKRVGHSKITALYHLNSFIAYRQKQTIDPNPERWIEECLNGNNLTLVKHLKVLKEWAEGESFDGSDDDTRINYYRDIRSFYEKNFVTLPRSKLDIQRRDETVIPTQVTATEFLKMAQKVLEHNSVTLRDRSIIMTMVQGGMDDSTLTEAFNFVAYPQLVKHFETEDFTRWDEEKVPVKIDLIRPKTDYLHFTGMHHDAIMLLKEWLAFRVANYGPIRIYPPKSPKQLSISDPIYVSKWVRRLRPPNVCELFRDSGKRAGVNILPEEFDHPERYKGARIRYPFHSHEARDTLITIARRLKVDIAVANFFTGHSIDRYQYDKSPYDYPDWFMEQYDILGQSLNIITQKEAFFKEKYENKLEHELASRDKELAEMKHERAADAEIIQRVLSEFADLKVSLTGRTTSVRES